MGSGAENSQLQGTPFGQGGQFSPVNAGNIQQAAQGAQGNPMAAWSLPLRTMTGMAFGGGSQPPQQGGMQNIIQRASQLGGQGGMLRTNPNPPARSMLGAPPPAQSQGGMIAFGPARALFNRYYGQG